jgi:hypothetical protein
MAAAIDWNPSDKVGKLAAEVVRIAIEGMGYTKFDQMRSHFNQTVEQNDSGLEVQIRAVTRLLIAKTRRESQPKSVADIQTAGLCLIWLSGTRVAEWSLLQLYKWGESLSTEGD